MEAAAFPRLDRDTQPGCRAHALLDATPALAAQLTLDGVCTATLDTAARVFGIRSGWVMTYEASTRVLRTIGSRGPLSDVYRPIRVPIGEGVAGIALVTREPLFVPDVASEQRWVDTPRMHASGLRSLLVLPLAAGKELIGVIALDGPFDAQHPPASDEMAVLEAWAAQAAVALRNARLFEAGRRARQRLRKALARQQRLSGQIAHLEREVLEASAGGRLIGDSPALRAAVEHAVLVARGDTTVLLLGETGTGKELLARLVHDRSRRARGPFIAVNCAAMPEALVESELFGHEKGAFTGAVARRPGSFEAAHDGTLLLDEVGDLPLDSQAKLLRVLQDRHVRRIGATRPIPVDVRVIAATNRDLEQAVVDGRFRADLYFRLAAFPLHTPALRERTSDIPLLVRYFLRHFAARLGKPAAGIAEPAMRRLVEYPWPGNIRELQNVIERAVILCQSDVIEDDVLLLSAGPVARKARGPHVSVGSRARVHPAPTLADAERRAILTALEASGWRVSGAAGAAARLGLKPTTLHGKMKRLGIERPKPLSPMRAEP